MPSFLLKLLLPMVLNLIHKALHDNRGAVGKFVSVELAKGLDKVDVPFMEGADEYAVKATIKGIADNLVTSGLDYVEANGGTLLKKVVK